MRLALLKGNRFNPWHLKVFERLRGAPEVTAFQAESEIQEYFRERGDGPQGFGVERIYFDTQRGNPFSRVARSLLTRYAGREPRIVPFAHRLEGYDVIQSWELFTDWTAEAVAARERFRIPLAVMVWDNIPFNMEGSPERRERKRRAAEIADVFLVHTKRSRRMLDMEGVASERVIKVDPGVDTDLFAPGTRDRAAFGLDEGEFVILFVGWFLPRKGVDFLVLALRELLADPDLRRLRPRLLMVGSGPGRDRVERLIARLGIGHACTFAGSMPYGRMPEVYRAADVFVLPSIATASWQEQFGMALIEAMASGLPSVATVTGGILEIARGGAVFCQPNDFLSLFESLKRLMQDRAAREGLGRTARSLAVERFGLERYAEALSNVYERLLAH